MKKFILGMLTVVLFMPICENITDVICGFLERLKANNTKYIVVANNEINKLSNESNESNENTYAIGFQTNSSEEYYDDFEEDVFKQQIGFR